ncbi:MAG TPA: recombination mediator RecR [Patescibacteria group bacterium]|nr:recombination mediator RecR [Patescibacteria group bacterium]
MEYPKTIAKLVEHFQKLPSVGPKTAERYVFHLLKKSPQELADFAYNLNQLKTNTKTCSYCQAISENNPCEICSDKNRDKKILCIMANTQEMISLENTRKYNGLYFILNNLINAIENQGPENLNVKKLIKRIKKEKIQEVILALSPTLEGESTLMYLSKILKEEGVKVSRLARGLPLGSSLEYTDEVTLSQSLKYRNIL